MFAKDEISTLMLRDHAKVEGIIVELSKSVDKGFKARLDIFNKFKWNIEKHFFVEEKCIFSQCHNLNEADLTAISNVMLDHKEILSMINQIEDDIIQKKKPELEELKKVLLEHKKYEESFLYPLLDKELSSMQKVSITERLKSHLST